ncbi:hypothetical protein BS78_06G048700 [Paspalum vaginatum]|nr:hypothetical protein BS78_06G048700 [Paspalum vaginatum]
MEEAQVEEGAGLERSSRAPSWRETREEQEGAAPWKGRGAGGRAPWGGSSKRGRHGKGEVAGSGRAGRSSTMAGGSRGAGRVPWHRGSHGEEQEAAKAEACGVRGPRAAAVSREERGWAGRWEASRHVGPSCQGGMKGGAVVSSCQRERKNIFPSKLIT